jgi:tetratricopeptide (TPR) repeat protein
MGCGLLRGFSLNPQDTLESKVPDAYSRGVQYYREGLYKSAVMELETVPRDHPRLKQARAYLQKANGRVTEATNHVNAALQHRKEGEFSKAKKEFEEALLVYPNHRRVRMLLEALDQDIEATVNFYYEKGQEEFERKNYEEAQVAFLEALKASPEENHVLAGLSRTDEILMKLYSSEGTALFEKGLFDEAVRQLEKAYNIDSTDSLLIGQLTNVYNRRALKYYREEKLSLAVRDLKRSLEIKSEQEEIRNQLQQIQKRLGLLKKIRP